MTTTNTGRNLIRPSDAASWTLCKRRTWLNIHQATDYEPDAFNQLLSEAGLQHEKNILAQFQLHYDVHQPKSFDHTHELMQQGVPIIYQAKLINREQGLVGSPDFLIRQENGLYQAADAKLSKSENKQALQIQLGLYRRLLDNQLPAMVYLGDGRTAYLGEETDELVDDFIDNMRQLHNQTQQPEVRYSHSRCRICPYFSSCRKQFETTEDISLLYGVHGQTAEHLAELGIQTISQLATADAEKIPDVAHLSGLKRKQRAIMQARSILNNEVFLLNDLTLPEGTWIHFDIEDNPLTHTRNRHVYLWGLLTPPYNNDNFDYVWTDDETQDYQGWLAFLEKMKQYRARYATIILAHYSNHEKTTIQKYAERYHMPDDDTVQWLLGLQDEKSPLFDMQKIVRDNLVLPIEGYGLKEICKHPNLVNFQWTIEASGSQWSVVQFSQFLQTTDPQTRQRLKSELLVYNHDDVMATRQLELWLRTLIMN